MLAAQYYRIVYLLIVTFLTFITLSNYSAKTRLEKHSHKKSSPIAVILLFVFMAFFIGLRPVSGKYFVDMRGYYEVYHALANPNYKLTWNTENKIFDNLFYGMAGAGIDVKYFFFLMAFIYFGGMAWASAKLFPNDKMAAFVVYLAAFSTFSYGTNGIKAGAAASLFLVALAMDNRGKRLWTIVFLLLSWGFHHSMILPVLGFIGCKFIKKPKWFFYFWVFCFIMALFHVTAFQTLFGTWADEQSAGYLIGGRGETIKTSVMGGFRIDFILYGAVPIIFGWIAVYQKKKVSRRYFFLLNLYTFINAIWMLCMYAEFTNRIAYLSWLMYPFVLIYPLLRVKWGKGQYHVFKWVAYGHLAFTIFMAFIYY